MAYLFTWEFWNSNFVQNIFVIIAGLTALVVYLLAKRAEKRNAARIILMEVRNAEQMINRLKSDRVITITGAILHSNSWGKYNHLFADVFDQDELDLISDFYSKAEGAEEQRKRLINTIPLSIDEKTKYIQQKLVDLALENRELSEQERNALYETERLRLIQMTDKETYTFKPAYPEEGLQHLANSITLISSSVAITKLKIIAK